MKKEFEIYSFIVFNMSYGELEQLSVPFKNYKDAANYRNGINKEKYPHTSILAVLN